MSTEREYDAGGVRHAGGGRRARRPAERVPPAAGSAPRVRAVRRPGRRARLAEHLRRHA
ncbi:hypothetical protein LT493_33590 [Streptomyces tricolor]|nr:hypothetical protein [Streptomyces tricolor]